MDLMKIDQAVIELQVSVKPFLATMLLRSLSEFQFAAGPLMCCPYFKSERIVSDAEKLRVLCNSINSIAHVKVKK